MHIPDLLFSRDRSAHLTNWRSSALLSLAFVCSIGFGLLAACVLANHGPAGFDAETLRWMSTHRQPDATLILRCVSMLHNTAGVLLLTGLAGWLFWHRGERFWACLLFIAVPSGMLLNLLLKMFFGRPRPAGAVLDGLASGLSFPSGHTMAAALIYGATLMGAYSCIADRQRRRAAVLLCVFAAFSVAFSRLYLGLHYLSDVVAAMLEAVAWLSLVFVMLRLVSQQGRKQQRAMS